MSEDVLELRERIKRLRAENRMSNLHNMNLYTDVVAATQMTKKIIELKNEMMQKEDEKTNNFQINIENEGTSMSEERMRRRKDLLIQIQKIKSENETLEEEIKVLNSDLSNFKTLHKVYYTRNPNLKCSVVPIN